MVLYKSGCVKFGQFTLKSGMESPFYIDLRNLVSFPSAMDFIGKTLAKKAKPLKFDRIAGVPYAGIPIAVVFSLHSKKPMIYTRKEKKEYGTKKMVEGEYLNGEKAIIVDDIITTGESKIDAIEPILQSGLKVTDVLVIVDREQGGGKVLREKGFILHSAIKITELIGFLEKKGLISKKHAQESLDFVKSGDK